ncbi:MAG: Lrp/AsnC ligand binding domain-containing protein [Deltaproteobacteria bacterium]|nr:Lrp/AsnC ligand binding domain-containing protein [Deltaproteobacteria bacterium]
MVTAFVLLNVPAKSSGEVVKELRKHHEIREACAVYGEADVMIKIQAASLEELDRLVMEVIQGDPNVRSTRTYLGIESLHWEKREAA